jgi:citrate synthase
MSDPTVNQKVTYSPGLAGIVAGESAIARIDTQRNTLTVRGYDLGDLTRGTYEEVAYLLLYGSLPTASQLEAFIAELGAQRRLPAPVIDLLRQAPATVHPMSLLRSAVSALEFDDADAGDNSHEANVRKAVRLLARIPTAVTAGYRLAHGQEPVEPLETEGTAANLLYMLRGAAARPHEIEALDVSLILYAEHGYNASAFTARVAASTLSDLYAAVTAAIGALAGPLHGGANEKAMEMLLEIGGADKAEAWVLEALTSKKKIMGFGHREYKSGDSRVPAMKAVGEKVAAEVGDASGWIETARIVEATMDREKGIFPNLDFPCAYTYYLMDIPIPLYTPIFVASRVAGWAAHIIEQHDGNRLIRPDHIYTGPEHTPYLPLDQR